MAQQQSFGALEFVDFNVVRERAELLVHLACNRLDVDVFLTNPRVFLGELVERAVDELAVRLRMFQLFEPLHALVVFDAVRLHLRDGR